MYFDDRCRNVARALLACYAEFGQDPIMLKGDPLTPAQEKWIWINLFEVESGEERGFHTSLASDVMCDLTTL